MTGPANATLIDRGGGLIYDDVLDITWLQDADYANTSGYVATLTYDSSRQNRMHWDEAMAWVDSLIYANYTDWRLPDHTKDEMWTMYHTNGVTGSNYDPFINLHPNSYASGTAYGSSNVWDFNFGNGNASTPGQGTWFYAWAVRDGDSSARVPEPATVLLLGSGLIALGAVGRKRRKG